MIQIRQIETETHLEFQFEDNGIGMEEKFFIKYLNSSADYIPSINIKEAAWLSPLQKNSRNHGGRIWLASKPQQGTTVFFTVKKRIESSAL